MNYLFTIIFSLSVISCNTKTNSLSDTELESTDTFTLPKDSLAFYFPLHSLSDKPSVDSFVQNWYASALYCLREPLLSRNYSGHNIYRFLWLRSFHRPVVISLFQTQEGFLLRTKMLDRLPQFREERISDVSYEGRKRWIDEGFVVSEDDPGLLIKKVNRRAQIIYNKTILLTKQNWDDFERLLAKNDFWNLPSEIDEGGTDGAQWVIEAHVNKKYHFVDYHSPQGTYSELGEFLIKLSGLDEEIY